MEHLAVTLRFDDAIEQDEIIALYQANRWAAADKPGQLLAGLRQAHSLVTARCKGRLVGLASAISDGHLVVYYSHLLVHPSYQRSGIGRQLMQTMQARYHGFHQQVLMADLAAVDFYHAMGFSKTKDSCAMWVFTPPIEGE